MISLDTETTGLDVFHGARPFFVTTCDEVGVNTFWEWPVDPLTRQPEIPEEDARKIRQLLARQHDGIALHNAPFDAGALLAADILDWSPLWELTKDTLCASHILASNQPHDLTSLAVEYLNIDIEPFEDRLKIAVNECRKLIRQARLRCSKGGTDPVDDELASWRIAEEGLLDADGRLEMPSAKTGSKKDKKGVESESPWKFDCWLPRAFARRFDYAEDHPWWTVCSEYANADSAVTLPMWLSMRDELERRGLMAIYEEKVKNLPILWEMSRRGVTVLHGELRTMREEYREEVKEAEAVCVGVAEGMCYELTLPKAGNNGSLSRFCFAENRADEIEDRDLLDLPVLKRTDTGKPSLDKDVIGEYLKVLSPGSKQLLFIRSLSRGRKRAKSCEFLDSYEVFGVPAPGDLLVLHPSVNPTATATTRMSMSNPNLQQVSRQESECERCLGDGCDACDGTGQDLRSVRTCFGPGPGREWWTADAENIELRLPATDSGERSLIALFEKPNEPPFYGSQHLLNCSVVYDDLWKQELRAVGIDKVGPHFKKKYGYSWYHFGKCGGLAMQYQCGEATADRTFRIHGGYRKLKEHFRALAALNDKWVKHAEKRGWVETMPDRSVSPERGYPLLCSRNFGRIVPTVPLNYRIQGTAGWWMVRAINRCQKKLVEWRAAAFDAWIALTVHDELVFDMPAAKERRLKNGTTEPGNLWRAGILQGLMEQGGVDIGVPTPVSINFCPKNWAEGQTFKRAA